MFSGHGENYEYQKVSFSVAYQFSVSSLLVESDD